MGYLSLKKAFYKPDVSADDLLAQRLSDPETVHLGLKIGDADAFFLMTTDIYQAILRTERADKKILGLTSALPSEAIQQFTIDNLLDEIVITNEIEGVNSTRREISDALASLERSDRKKRFWGLVSKYQMLRSNRWEKVETPQDIRDVYDALVYQEIERDNPNHLPDGAIFRKDPVSIYDPAQREVHKGLNPEEQIVAHLDESLRFLNGAESVDMLARLSAFHFLLGYAHPFYDGNGRVNRFISSQYLAAQYEPVVGFGLSFSIKQHIDEYYAAFTECEDPRNHGDITPFVIMFCNIVAEATERIERSLAEKQDRLDRHATVVLDVVRRSPGLSKRTDDIAYVLLQAALFTQEGITIHDLVTTFGFSKATIRKKLDELSGVLPVSKLRVGREDHYMIDLPVLGEEHSAD